VSNKILQTLTLFLKPSAIEFRFHCFDIVLQGFSIITPEWEISCNRKLQYNPQTPHIKLVILLQFLQRLGWHLIRSAHQTLDVLVRTNPTPEIHYPNFRYLPFTSVFIIIQFYNNIF
jgi:hypothetical protein